MLFALYVSQSCFLLADPLLGDSGATEEDHMLLFLSSGARSHYREDIVRTLALLRDAFSSALQSLGLKKTAAQVFAIEISTEPDPDGCEFNEGEMQTHSRWALFKGACSNAVCVVTS
jgi:hypothetical protein